MSFLAKRELFARVAPRYQSATPQQKPVILDEFVAVTGYARKYAIRLLAHPVITPVPLTRPRERFYGAAVQDALVVAWTAASRICAKRLVPFLPELAPVLERHGHLALTDAVREQLLALEQALVGQFGGHQRFMVARQLAHIDFLAATIAAVSGEIADCRTTATRR